MTPNQIWTIGHSNRQLADLLAILQSHGIQLIADVRRFPGSRRQPRFGGESLERALRDAGIGYLHFPDLGGRRRDRLTDSPNGGWRVESFNAYADYTHSPQFQHALNQLIEVATTTRTSLMCSEALPWRCHRRLIADSLLVRGWTVHDIFGPSRAKQHELPPFAQIVEGHVIYPPES